VSVEAILSAEIVEKPLGGRGSASNAARGAHSAPRPLPSRKWGCCFLAPMTNRGHALVVTKLRT